MQTQHWDLHVPDYGSALLTNLSKDLKLQFGKGFSKSNIYLCRQFYLKYQIPVVFARPKGARGQG
ncbi:DUF1016 N-terminal domain-containing protein [Hufsiella ginkgonis]|uniref:DUF1016 N-terminal domain-containing protein n=1 Tax=Hufsiella ginkgonis TaxID=2695274 RepID=UPI0034E29B6B